MSIPKEGFFADSMAFFAPPGQKPKFALGSRPRLNLALLTSAKPFAANLADVLEEHSDFTVTVLSNPNVHEVRSAMDLDRPASIGVLFGLQCAPKGLTLTDLHSLKFQGIRFMSLAYGAATEYGGGFLSGRVGDRLTIRGKKLIDWMSLSGITLDLSHTGPSTMREAIAYIRQKKLPIRIVATHSGCYSVCPHSRNLPDDVLKEVEYVGIPAINFYLGPKGGDYFAAFARHVEYAIKVAGKGKVGIGSDCPHVSMTMEDAEANFKRMQEMLKTGGSFGEYFPDRPPELIRHGASMFKVIAHSPEMKLALASDPGVLGANFRNFLALLLPQI